MEENQDRYEIDFETANGVLEKRKVITRIPKKELDKYRKLGEGGGPIEVALAMGVKHCPHFAERVVGYTVSEEGIGSMIGEAMKKMLPDHPQAASRGYTYAFYEPLHSGKTRKLEVKCLCDRDFVKDKTSEHEGEGFTFLPVGDEPKEEDISNPYCKESGASVTANVQNMTKKLITTMEEFEEEAKKYDDDFNKPTLIEYEGAKWFVDFSKWEKGGDAIIDIVENGKHRPATKKDGDLMEVLNLGTILMEQSTEEDGTGFTFLPVGDEPKEEDISNPYCKESGASVTANVQNMTKKLITTMEELEAWGKENSSFGAPTLIEYEGVKWYFDFSPWDKEKDEIIDIVNADGTRRPATRKDGNFMEVLNLGTILKRG